MTLMLKMRGQDGRAVHFVRQHIQVIERDGEMSIIRVHSFGYAVIEDHESIILAMTGTGDAFARDDVIDVAEIAAEKAKKAKKGRI